MLQAFWPQFWLRCGRLRCGRLRCWPAEVWPFVLEPVFARGVLTRFLAAPAFTAGFLAAAVFLRVVPAFFPPEALAAALDRADDFAARWAGDLAPVVDCFAVPTVLVAMNASARRF